MSHKLIECGVSCGPVLEFYQRGMVVGITVFLFYSALNQFHTLGSVSDFIVVNQDACSIILVDPEEI